jgi:hypothetical protein
MNSTYSSCEGMITSLIGERVETERDCSHHGAVGSRVERKVQVPRSVADRRQMQIAAAFAHVVPLLCPVDRAFVFLRVRPTARRNPSLKREVHDAIPSATPCAVRPAGETIILRSEWWWS